MAPPEKGKMDICVEFMLNAPADEDLQEDMRGKWFQQGDIICTYPATQMGALSGQNYIPHTLPIPHPRDRYLFVKSIPDSFNGVQITIAKINGILGRGRDDGGFREWNLWADLSNGVKNSINNNGYDTINFAQLKSALRSKVTNNLITDLDIVAD